MTEWDIIVFSVNVELFWLTVYREDFEIEHCEIIFWPRSAFYLIAKELHK